MGKTPEYVKKAVSRYNSKFDRLTLNLPKGTRDLIKELTGLSCNKYILNLIEKDLKVLQSKK